MRRLFHVASSWHFVISWRKFVWNPFLFAVFPVDRFLQDKLTISVFFWNIFWRLHHYSSISEIKIDQTVARLLGILEPATCSMQRYMKEGQIIYQDKFSVQQKLCGCNKMICFFCHTNNFPRKSERLNGQNFMTRFLFHMRLNWEGCGLAKGLFQNDSWIGVTDIVTVESRPFLQKKSFRFESAAICLCSSTGSPFFIKFSAIRQIFHFTCLLSSL